MRKRYALFKIAALLLVASLTSISHADDRDQEYTGEFDAFHNFSPGTRLFLIASANKTEGKDALQDQLGVNFDFSSKQGVRERLHIADWARARTIGLRVGYRQFRHWDGEREGVNEKRALAEVTWRGTLPYRFGMSHRLGYDYRDLPKGDSQRYRYRFNLDRDVTVGRTPLVPYFQAEFTYDTRYNAWNRQHYQLGSEIGLSEHWRLEPYFSIDRDVEPKEAYTNRIGLIAKLYW